MLFISCAIATPSAMSVFTSMQKANEAGPVVVEKAAKYIIVTIVRAKFYLKKNKKAIARLQAVINANPQKITCLRPNCEIKITENICVLQIAAHKIE